MAPVATSPTRQQVVNSGVQNAREAIYQEATRAFLLREHLAAYDALLKLLATLPARSANAPKWYERSQNIKPGEREVERWRTKGVKLAITYYAALHHANPALNAVPADLGELLSPSSATVALDKGLSLCISQYADQGSGLDSVPATMVATLALASLKLGPEAVSHAKKIIEDWLSSLPLQLEVDMVGGRAEGVAEDYQKVIELYVGEILAREGEWEMASMFLETEPIMSSKRKETLFLKLRSLKMRMKSSKPVAPASPPSLSASMMESEINPSPGRSRSSSSSSERTARPVEAGPTVQSLTIPQRPSRKGKEKAADAEDPREKVSGSAATPPLSSSSIPTMSTSSTAITTVRSMWSSIAGKLPQHLIPTTKRQVTLLSLPIACSILIYILRVLFRRQQPTTIREKLRMRQDWRQWVLWVLLQSWQKTKGVLKLGTTITYI